MVVLARVVQCLGLERREFCIDSMNVRLLRRMRQPMIELKRDCGVCGYEVRSQIGALPISSLLLSQMRPK